jgi:hypothetical protein
MWKPEVPWLGADHRLNVVLYAWQYIPEHEFAIVVQDESDVLADHFCSQWESASTQKQNEFAEVLR